VRSLRSIPLVTLTLFAVGMTIYIYGYEHRADADYAREEGVEEAFVLACAAVLHVVLGAVLRLKAIPALVLPVVLAIPAGDYPGGWPEVPVAYALFVQELFFGIPLVLLGFTIAWAYDRLVRTEPPTAVSDAD
jgi:hypothetical protein